MFLCYKRESFNSLATYLPWLKARRKIAYKLKLSHVWYFFTNKNINMCVHESSLMKWLRFRYINIMLSLSLPLILAFVSLSCITPTESLESSQTEQKFRNERFGAVNGVSGRFRSHSMMVYSNRNCVVLTGRHEAYLVIDSLGLMSAVSRSPWANRELVWSGWRGSQWMVTTRIVWLLVDSHVDYV